jgi:hypothetical protein
VKTNFSEDCIRFPFEVFFLKESAPLDPQIAFRRLDSVKANSRTCPFCRLLHRAAFTFAYREFTRYGHTAKRLGNIKKPPNHIQSPSFFHFIRRAEDALEGCYGAIHPSVLLASLVLENHIRDGRESIPTLDIYITPLETDPGTKSRPLARNLVDYLERLSQPLSLQKSIPKLPKTIRDAIYTVENIRERHSWVDSLCIPPDPAIKADQINNMDQVYGSALPTIIAADGINSNAGLTGVLPKSRSLYQLEQKITPHLRLAVILPIPMRRISETIWNHPGWTFQERFLSKRLLTFTSGQTTWQCNSNTLFEDVGLELKPGGDRFDDLRRISIKPPPDI